MSNNKDSRLNWDKYTWEQFEDICYEYTSEKYNSDIYQVSITKRRKDGGRDIIISNQVNKKTAWGECKHHKNSVGLDDIGKNVVLAMTNQIQKMIFFSVSNVTPNTKHEILFAAKLHGFDVLFLDGKDLDCEIAGNKQLLRKYFEESFELFNPKTETLDINVCIDEFTNAYNDTFYKDSRYYRLENGLDFYIHIFIKNYYSANVDSFELSIHEQMDCHFYSTTATIDKINSFCDAVLTIRGIVLNTQHAVSLPTIKCVYQINQHVVNRSIDLGEIDGRDIWKVSMCGEENIQFLSLMDSLCKQVVNGHAKIIYIRGVSGSGKSRMLEEIASLMVQKNFMLIYIDAMKYQKNYLFRELIRQLLCIPHLNSNNKFEKYDFVKLVEKYHINHSDVTTIYNFIWKNRRISSTILSDFIYQCIISIPITTRFYIQIDNIQSLDTETQRCILFLCSKLLEEKCHVCFAFTLNTSFSKNSDKDPLVQYFESQRLHKEDPTVFSHTMKKLDEPGRQHMVKESLHMSSNYEKEIALIANKSGALPLDILLFCKMLSNSNCFVWNENVREIQDPEKFSEYMSTLPDTVSSIIQTRLDAIYKTISNKESLDKFFQLIVFFANRLPLRVADSFKINRNLITKLKEDLVVLEDAGTCLSFFHDNYYRHFLSKGNTYCFSTRELLQLLNYSKEYEDELGPVMVVNQIRCLYLLGMKDEFQELALEKLFDFKVSGFYSEIITLATFYLSKNRSAKYKNRNLLFMIEKAAAQMETVSFVQGIKTLKEIEKKINSNDFTYDSSLVGKFYHHYVNSYTHAGNYNSALDVLQKFELIEKLNHEQKFLIEDRYCLCHFSLGNFDMAEQHIKKAIAIAKKMKSDFWISTAYSDRAFNYFTNTIDISKIKYNFRQAIKKYNKENDISEYRSIEIQIQSALLALLEEKYNSAKESIDKAIAQATERTYTYLLIPAQNVKAYILLKKNQVEYAIALLERARLNSEIFGSTKYMIIILNSLGIAYCAKGDCKNGHKCFVKAEKILKTYSCPDDCSVRFAPLIVNWILSSCQLRPELLQSNIEFSRYTISSKVQDILNHLYEGQPVILNKYFPLVHKGFAMLY